MPFLRKHNIKECIAVMCQSKSRFRFKSGFKPFCSWIWIELSTGIGLDLNPDLDSNQVDLDLDLDSRKKGVDLHITGA